MWSSEGEGTRDDMVGWSQVHKIGTVFSKVSCCNSSTGNASLYGVMPSVHNELHSNVWDANTAVRTPHLQRDSFSSSIWKLILQAFISYPCFPQRISHPFSAYWLGRLLLCAYFGLFRERKLGEFFITLQKQAKQLNILLCIIFWSG